MATAQQTPAPASVQQHLPATNGDLESQNNQALVAMPGRKPEQLNPLALSAPVALLPWNLTSRFRSGSSEFAICWR